MDVSPELKQLRQRLYRSYRNTMVKNIYDKSAFPLEAQIRQYRQRWQRFLPADRDSKILDIGCGGGEFLLYLSLQGYHQLEGIDVSPDQVALARQRGLEHVQLIDAVAYLTSRQNSYDLINVQNLLEHQTRPELLALMDLIVASINPDGVVFGVVPNSKSIFSTRIRYADLTHELSFTPESLRQLFAVVRLSPVAMHEHGPLAHNFVSTIRWAIWQFIRLGIWIAYTAENADYTDRIYTHDMMFIARKDIH